MSAFLNQRLTNGGWDALSIALGGGRLTFFKMQAGSGTIANDDAIMGMAALVAPVCDIPITSYVIEGDGQITLFGNINSSELDVGFTFKELGVFATIEDPTGRGGTPSGPNIQAISQAPQAPSTQANPVVPTPPDGTALMYSYANAYELGDYIPGSGETSDVTNTVQVTIKIAEAENVVINIIAGEQFAVTNIGPPSVGAGPWSYTQANVAYLKRLQAGAAMIITEDADKIVIAVKQLTADLDLYVANGNPDIAPDFSTIQNAIDYLGQYLIPTTIRARIHVQPGTYVMPGNHAYLNHPNSQNITIQGPQNNSVTGTSVSITGSINNWSVTVSGIANTSQFVVNDWVIVDLCAFATSNNQALICGFFKVTAKTAGSVTYLVPYNKSSFSVTGVTLIQLTPISAILSCPLNTVGFYTGAYGIGTLQYLGIVAQQIPTANVHGLIIGGKGILKYCGAHGFNAVPLANGTVQTGGIISGWGSTGDITCISCATTYCMHGFVGSGGGSINSVRCSASHNRVRGFWLDSGGSCNFTEGYSHTGGNGDVGMLISAGTSCSTLPTSPFGFLVTQRNDSWGMHVTGRGYLQINQGCYIYSAGNTTYDAVADIFGCISGQTGIQGGRVFNLPIGQISASGGLIT